MIKLGILVECSRAGIESVMVSKICSLLAVDHNQSIDVDIVPMDSKKKLILDCATAIELLIAQGCSRVVVLWDERPAWPDKQTKLCWHNDRIDILARVTEAKLPIDKIHLVCIEREFESWLLHDYGMLTRAFSRTAHRYPVKEQPRPDRLPNPKGRMGKLCKDAGWGKYNDMQWAPTFAKELTDLKKLRKCATFQRFESRLMGT